MRAGVWLSGVAAGLAFVVGIAAAISGLAWLLVPAVASLVTALAWAERRSIWWGVAAVVAQWAPIVLVAAAAWEWVAFGLPLVPAAVAQTAALVQYSRSRRAATISVV